MQDFSSTVSYSPSFSYYASGDFAAVKVSHENQSYKFTDHQSVNDLDTDFEFQTSPLHIDRHNSSTSLIRSELDVVFITNKNEDDVAVAAEKIPDHFSETCLWSPLTYPAASEIIKRSDYSSNIPKRCRLKKLLSRNKSNGAVSSPSASKRCILKDLIMRNKSHRNDGDASKTSSPAVKGKEKTASHKVAEGDNRRIKSYLPYRQDLIGVFAGIRRLRH